MTRLATVCDQGMRDGKGKIMRNSLFFGLKTAWIDGSIFTEGQRGGGG